MCMSLCMFILSLTTVDTCTHACIYLHIIHTAVLYVFIYSVPVHDRMSMYMYCMHNIIHDFIYIYMYNTLSTCTCTIHTCACVYSRYDWRRSSVRSVANVKRWQLEQRRQQQMVIMRRPLGWSESRRTLLCGSRRSMTQ